MLASIAIWVLLGPAPSTDADETLAVLMVSATVTDLRHSFERLVLLILRWIVAAGPILIAGTGEQALGRGLAAGQVWHASHGEVLWLHLFAVMVCHDTHRKEEQGEGGFDSSDRRQSSHWVHGCFFTVTLL